MEKAWVLFETCPIERESEIIAIFGDSQKARQFGSQRYKRQIGKELVWKKLSSKVWEAESGVHVYRAVAYVFDPDVGTLL